MRAESLQVPARGSRSTTRKRPGATRVEPKRRVAPREGRALTTGARAGAGRTTRLARQELPARSEAGGAESCAWGAARARAREKSASTDAQCSTGIVLLTT